MEEALLEMWRLVNPTVPHHTGSDYTGIFKFWAGMIDGVPHYKELGSPIGHEHPASDGVVQAFAACRMVEWRSDGPHIL